MMGTLPLPGKAAKRERGRLLVPWEEAVGVLRDLAFDEGMLQATIGPVRICLPSEMEEELRPQLGRKIGVIRTDDPVRSYRIRDAGG